MDKKINKILLWLIVGMLILPLLQYYTSVVFVKPLHGSYIKHQEPEFSIKGWFNNDFQKKFDSYYNQNFGFRSELVRLHNQLEYSLYNKVNANDVVVGKDNYLYEKHYIISYQGGDFIGRDSIYSRVEKIQTIYRELQKHQTELLVVIAPGKGWFYPEFIPDSMLSKRDTTNYEIYLEALNEAEIPLIDFNDLFLQMKDTSSIVIYPKTGIHWSQGIIPFVADSIFKKIESLINRDLPHIYWERTANVSRADKQDADIEKGLNLLLPLKVPPMNYPKITFEKFDQKSKPKAITIADSFWWQLFNLGVSKKVFDQGKFWYYYKQIYPDSFDKPLMVQDIDAKEDLYQTDIVVLMATETNLYKFPYGFENVLEAPISDSLFQAKVERLMRYIKTDEKWFEKIKQKAILNNIPIDSMLYLDAKYTVSNQK
ncbi:MAG: hypothetical protein GQ527_04940 [Bacteroidales bacterium]|nr:hypothetical protein [Bacteroidales bacterium]